MEGLIITRPLCSIILWIKITSNPNLPIMPSIYNKWLRFSHRPTLLKMVSLWRIIYNKTSRCNGIHEWLGALRWNKWCYVLPNKIRSRWDQFWIVIMGKNCPSCSRVIHAKDWKRIKETKIRCYLDKILSIEIAVWLGRLTVAHIWHL